MIRRAAWLTAGAVGGIYGYRRLGKLARSLVPRPTAAPSYPAAGRGLGLRGRRHLTAGTGPAAAGSAATRGTAPRRWRASGAAEFWRDVRDGMAEYLDRHDS